MKKTKFLLMVAPLFLLTSCGDKFAYNEPKFNSYKNEVSFEYYSNYNAELMKNNKFYGESISTSFTFKADLGSVSTISQIRDEKEISRGEEKVFTKALINYDDTSRAAYYENTFTGKEVEFDIKSEQNSSNEAVENLTQKQKIQDEDYSGNKLATKINEDEKTCTCITPSVGNTFNYSFKLVSEIMGAAMEDFTDYSDATDEEKENYKIYVDGNTSTILYEESNTGSILISNTESVGTREKTKKNKVQIFVDETTLRFVSTYEMTSKSTYNVDYSSFKNGDVVNKEIKHYFWGELKAEDVSVNKIDTTDFTRK